MANITDIFCPNDCTSKWNGVCNKVNGMCECNRLFGPGPNKDCSDDYMKSVKGFAGFFWFYDALMSLLFVLLVAVSILFIYRSIKIHIAKSQKPELASPLFVFILVACGAIIRLIMLLFDPHNVREWFIPEGYDFSLSLPIVFWAEAGYLLLIFWLDLALRVKELKNSRLSKARIPLVVAFVITFILILAVTINEAVSLSASSLLVYNVVVVLILLFFLIFVFVFGGKLYFVLKNVTGVKTSTSEFLNRTMKLMFGLNFAIIFVILCLIGHVVFFGNPWAWIILHFFIRIGELAICLQLMFIVMPKVQQTNPTSSEGMSATKHSGSASARTDFSNRLEQQKSTDELVQTEKTQQTDNL